MTYEEALAVWHAADPKVFTDLHLVMNRIPQWNSSKGGRIWFWADTELTLEQLEALEVIGRRQIVFTEDPFTSLSAAKKVLEDPNQAWFKPEFPQADMKTMVIGGEITLEELSAYVFCWKHAKKA